MPDQWREGPGGILELISEKGEVLAIQKVKHTYTDSGGVLQRKFRGRPSKAAAQTHHYVLDSRGRKIWVPKGTNPEHLPNVIYPYNQITAELICRFVREGKTLLAISQMEGMPPRHAIFTWKARYPEFKALVDQAKKDRAEYFADLAIEEAENSKESRVQSDRLRTETYKWAAEVGDREQFGRSMKHTGDPAAPLGFIIDTGIRRDPPAAPTPPPSLPEPGSPAESAVKPPKENPS